MQLLNLIFKHCLTFVLIDLPQISSVEVTLLCVTEFNIRWSASYVRCGDMNYAISLLPSLQNNGPGENRNVSNNYYKFSNLRNDTSYVVEVSATNRLGTGNIISRNVKTPRSKCKLFNF